jgi:hypothetical protein
MEPPRAWKPLPKTIEQHEADEKRTANTLKLVEDYWSQIAPYGAPQFDAGRGMELLLFDANRYRDGLHRVIAKAQEQEDLIKHREASGQEVTEADRQRWFAYLEAAHIAQDALSPNGPPENSDERGR